jgi:hypothetical protein
MLFDKRLETLGKPRMAVDAVKAELILDIGALFAPPAMPTARFPLIPGSGEPGSRPARRRSNHDGLARLRLADFEQPA